jgi:hypothetical protein
VELVNEDVEIQEEEIVQTMVSTSEPGNEHCNNIYIEILNKHFNINSMDMYDSFLEFSELLV